MDMQAFDLVRQLAASQYLVRSLHVAAKVGVADAVGPNGSPVATNADELKADPDALERIMRLLASRKILRLECLTHNGVPAAAK